jgi:colanic acid/amylovoran biosynthesis protein
MPDPSPRRVLIVNQHGENRGDESALRAMMGAFADRLGAVQFTVVIQARQRGFRIETPHAVEFLSAFVPVSPRLFRAYREADLVVSAPGGPYFGDLYWSHEPLHWWYVGLGLAHRKPVFLYAPSAGPYRRPLWNCVRRWLLRRFAEPLVVREPESARHLAELVGPEVPIVTTADSAFQQRVEPLPRTEYFTGERAPLADRFLVAVSARDRRDPCYDDAFRAAIVHIDHGRGAHFVLLPQLTGAHSDVHYLETLARALPASVSWEVADPALDAVAQRRIVAMSDFCLAGRYHPQVFAASAAVPGVCVYYEHKALGLMQEIGLPELALDAESVDGQRLVAAVDDALARHDELGRLLASAEARLRAAAARTTALAVAALGARS